MDTSKNCINWIIGNKQIPIKIYSAGKVYDYKWLQIYKH